MSKTSKIISILLALAIILTSVGCASEAPLADETQMAENLNKYLLNKKSILETEKVDSVKIEERTTNQSKTEDEIICNVEIVDENESYKATRQYTLYYEKNSEKEWEFSRAKEYNEHNRKTVPTKGVSDEEVKSLLSIRSITIDGVIWSLDDEDFSNFVVTREPDFENGKEICTAKIQMEYEVQTVNLEIKIPYYFKKTYSTSTSYEWEDDYENWETKAEITYAKGKELDLSQERVVADILKAEEIYAGGGIYKQKIVVNKDNIKNFKVDLKRRPRGAYQAVKCSFDVTNGLVNVNVEADMTYSYKEDKWQPENVSVKPETSIMDMKGVWKGTYSGNKDITIEITSYSVDYIKGKFTYEKGTLDISSSFSGIGLRFSLPSSYAVSDMREFMGKDACFQFDDSSFTIKHGQETIVLKKQ